MTRQEGSYLERPPGSGRWLVRLYLGTNAGKRQYANRTVRGKERDAKQALREMLTARDRNEGIAPGRITVNAYLDKWLAESVRPSVRKRTLDQYTELLQRHVRPKIGDRALARLSPLDVQSFITAMQVKTPALSARSIRYTFVVFKAALAQAVLWRMLPSNPAGGASLPPATKPKPVAMLPEQVKAFLAALEGREESTMFSLAVVTGLRPCEYLGLQWPDLDGAELVIRRSLQRDGTFEAPKTETSIRRLKLAPSVLEILRAHKARQSETILAGRLRNDLGLVFPNAKGKPYAHATVFHRFKSALQRAGLPNFRLYDLRATCATMMFRNGEQANVVAKQLGHTKPGFTLEVYGAVHSDMQQGAADRLAGSILGEPK